MIGKTISHYRIVGKIGEGGMGVVYKARDTHLERFAAIKVLRPEKVASPERKGRFVQEARSASALNHPNIIHIYDIDQQDGVDFISMEYVAGKTLDELIPRNGMRLNDLLRYSIQVADALAAAHEAGIIHRDLKPRNIMVDDDGRVRVLDFGLAKLAEQSEAHELDSTVSVFQERAPRTVEGTILGTISYMSPEQADAKKIDVRSDIFSFGSLLYEMVTGKRAFQKNSALSTLTAILHEDPKLARETAEAVSPDLVKIITRCLRKDPLRRWQHMTDVKVALEELREESNSGGPRGGADAAPPPRRARLSSFVAAVLALLIFALTAFWWWDHFTPTSTDSAEASIAVMPFVNRSPSPENDYLSDGMTDELINALTKIRGLHVVARNSVFQFKGKEIDLRQIAERLRVQVVLQGTVRKSGEQLRIMVELVDVRTGHYLWSETYDVALENVFAVQREITQAVTGSLQRRLMLGQASLSTHAPTQNLKAYRAYLMGRYHWNKRSPEGLNRALGYLEEAVREDPSFAAAFAGIADTYTALVDYGNMAPEEGMPKAKIAALKALTIDGSLAEAHASIGWIATIYDWDWDTAEKSYKRAIELNPSYATARLWYAVYLTIVGRPADSISEIRAAQILDPLSVPLNANLGWLYLFRHEYDNAIEQAKKALELDPQYSYGYNLLAEAYAYKGMTARALEACERGAALSGNHSLSLMTLGVVYALSGRKADSDRVIEKLKARWKEGDVRAWNIAMVYASLGLKEHALEWLGKAYEEHDLMLPFIIVDPCYDGIRSDSRFVSLVERIGLRQGRPR